MGKARVARELMAAGAPIAELNTVRKHLSKVKGGQLAAAFSCGVTALVLSDVVGDAFDVVGSGPLAPDPTTLDDAAAILERRLSPATSELARAALVETAKSTGVRHVLVAGPALARDAAAEVARARLVGVSVAVDPTPVEGEVSALAAAYAARLWGTEARPGLTVAVGEPVVRTPAGARTGIGGRSLQLALELARLGRAKGGWAFLAAGTDGRDGSSKAAGALVDGTSWERIGAAGLDGERSLAEFNAEPALEAAGCLVVTGPTGNNLQDLHLLFVGAK
ncbi:MAG: DUF4147 domain-containing protein [Deltaproteobacteria bacterium]|nr:DUF4147 domain-containing protein [Deltaproteobacteria bacterium]